MLGTPNPKSKETFIYALRSNESSTDSVAKITKKRRKLGGRLTDRPNQRERRSTSPNSLQTRQEEEKKARIGGLRGKSDDRGRKRPTWGSR